MKPGMVMTIEPKLYIPEKNIVIMVENMILIKPMGAKNLAPRTPKKVSEIERIMRLALAARTGSAGWPDRARASPAVAPRLAARPAKAASPSWSS